MLWIWHQIHCTTTLHCVPSLGPSAPVHLPGPTGPVIGPGPIMATMALTPYQKCYNDCIKQGGYPWECKVFCGTPSPHYLSEPEPVPW